jgi:hypothetical protein
MAGWGGLIATLLVVSQLTRFESTVEVTYDGTNLNAVVQGVPLELQLPQQKLDRLTASFQRSRLAETGLVRLQVSQGDRVIVNHEKRSLYLWGRDLLDNWIHAPAYPCYRNTLGDWTQDRFESGEVPLLNHGVEAPFKIQATFIGRGARSLSLYMPGRVHVGQNDGYIDNNTFISRPDSPCGYHSFEPSEARLINLSRIINLLTEAVFTAMLLVFPFRLLGFGIPPASAPQTHQTAGLFLFLRAHPSRVIALLVAALALLHLTIGAFFSYHVMGGIPHIPDSAVYYRQALILLSGHLTATPPTAPYEAFLSNGGMLRGSHIFYHYPFFWPVMLAGFAGLRLAPLANPLISSACLVMIYLTGAKMFNPRTGLVAALCYGISPLAIVLSGDYLTHQAAMLCCLVTIWASLKYLDRKNAAWLALAGFSFAYGFGIRSLTTPALCLPVLASIAIAHRRAFLSFKALAAAAGALPVLAACMLNNKFLTGDYLTTGYRIYHHLSVTWEHLTYGLNWGDSTLAFLPSILWSLPVCVLSLALIFVVFFFRPSWKDFSLLSAALCLIGAHFFINSYGIHGYGPRFYFEALFAFCLLAARGGCALWDHCAANWSRITQVALWAVLIAYNAMSAAANLPCYRNYNGIDQELYERIRTMDLAHSAVVIKERSWQSLDIAAVLFDPEFKKAVFIRDGFDPTLPEKLGRKAIKW